MPLPVLPPGTAAAVAACDRHSHLALHRCIVIPRGSSRCSRGSFGARGRREGAGGRVGAAALAAGGGKSARGGGAGGPFDHSGRVRAVELFELLRRCKTSSLSSRRPMGPAAPAAAAADAVAGTVDSGRGVSGGVIDDATVAAMVREALAWCCLNGLVVGDAEGQGGGTQLGRGMVHAPVTLLPTPFPRRAFEQAVALAPALNDLVDAVSQDAEFLQSTLASAAASDDFTRRLLDIHRRITYEEAAGKCTPKAIRLGMHRSDYMLDTGAPPPTTAMSSMTAALSAPSGTVQGLGGDTGSSRSMSEGSGTSMSTGTGTGTLLQVELNTVASSFPGLSSRVTALHRHLLSSVYAPLASGEIRGGPQDDDDDMLSALPDNPAADAMAEALALAWAEQGDYEAAVLFVVQRGERNLYDQHWLSATLASSRHRVSSLRRTLAQLHDEASVDNSGQLLVGGTRVSVVYFRAGYDPSDYPSEVEWRARELLERSSAVCCPSVAYHLAGAKKVQQKLAEPGCLERFVASEQVAQQIRACFAGLWGLEGVEGRAAAMAAVAEPHKFVLKPQREGGGNNIYGDDVRTKILELLDKDGKHGSGGKHGNGGVVSAEEGGGSAGAAVAGVMPLQSPSPSPLSAFILMQRIWPAVNSTVMLRRGEWAWADSLSELGIYSTYLRNGDRVILSRAAGHLLRTKTASSDEGGVAAGFAVLDSPRLIS